jgi:L-malate glycosyltransferase
VTVPSWRISRGKKRDGNLSVKSKARTSAIPAVRAVVPAVTAVVPASGKDMQGPSQSHQLRVFVAGRGIPTDKYPLRGIFEYDQAKALAQAGCSVIYAAIDMRSFRHARTWGLQTFIKDGVTVYLYNVPAGKVGLGVKKAIASRLLKRVYRKAVAEFGQIDILHAHFPEIGSGTISLAEQTGLPFIYTEHFSRVVQERVRRSLEIAVRNIYAAADLVIAVSPDLKHRLEHRYPVKPEVIPNIVDTATYHYVPGLKDAERPFTCISVGALTGSKRMDLTVRAFSAAFYHGSRGEGRLADGPILHIFGNGPEQRKLEGLISSLDLKERIFLHGQAPRTVIAECMAGSDCFVLASRSETFGVVFIEALAAGLPVISTRCGGPEHFIHAGNGMLVPVDDEKALASALKTISLKIDFYNREAVSREISRQFSPQAVSEQLVAWYKRVIAGREN